jgi:hypothetical protein
MVVFDKQGNKWIVGEMDPVEGRKEAICPKWGFGVFGSVQEVDEYLKN